MFKFVKKC